MTKPKTLLISLLFVSTTAASRAQGWACEYSAVSDVDGVRKTEGGRLILDGKERFRWERTANGKQVVIIGMGVDVWALTPENKTATHGRISADSVKALDSSGQFLGRELDTFLKTGAKKIGRQKLDGQEFDMYQRIEKGGIKLTLWVLPDGSKLTRRQQTYGDLYVSLRPGEPPAQHKFLRQLDFKNWKPVKSLEPALFRPPAGYRIVEGKGPKTAPKSGKP